MRKIEKDKLLADLLRKFIADSENGFQFIMTAGNNICLDGWIEGCSPEQMQVVEELMKARSIGG